MVNVRSKEWAPTSAALVQALRHRYTWTAGAWKDPEVWNNKTPRNNGFAPKPPDWGELYTAIGWKDTAPTGPYQLFPDGTVPSTHWDEKKLALMVMAEWGIDMSQQHSGRFIISRHMAEPEAVRQGWCTAAEVGNQPDDNFSSLYEWSQEDQAALLAF